MGKKMCSVGLDIGTTSTQLVISDLEVEDRAGAFSVPSLQITERKLRYCSPVYFTPLRSGQLVDGDGIREIVEREYEKAGITRSDVDTGAVIITGETSRKENAAAVLKALSEYAGDFVVATAGPALESVLAARGAGAVEFSEATGTQVLHMDIGGGTANIALIDNGKIVATDCLNVGGRLIKVKGNGKVYYISPVLNGICPFSIGDIVTPAQLQPMACTLTQGLEMAAGLREKTALLDKLRTEEMGEIDGCHPVNAIISFSGGVADCIDEEHPPFEFGDMGPILGQAIRESRLCAGRYRLGKQTIRATVIGAGCHSTQLSGSTVFCRNVALPLKNRPCITLTEEEQCKSKEELCRCIRAKTVGQDVVPVLAIPGFASAGYAQVKFLAEAIADAMEDPIVVAVEQDMAKALGQAIAMRHPGGCLCIDRVKLCEGDFLDVGMPIGPALPVVVKTLILDEKIRERGKKHG